MYRLVLTGLVPVLFAAVSGAQTHTVLTEADYLSALTQDHPAVRKAAEAVALGQARGLEVSTFDNPVLNTVGEDPSGAVSQTEFVLSWQLPNRAMGALKEAHTEEMTAATRRFQQQLLNHRITMQKVYAHWATSELREQQLASQAQRVQALADRETARSTKGETSGLKAHRLRLAAATLHSRVALASSQRELAWAQAATWYPDLPIDVSPVLPAVPLAPSLDLPSSQIRIAEADLAAARLAREASGRFIDSPEMSLGWQRQEAGSETIDGPIFGLAWAVPLFDRNQAAQSAAEARVDGAQARLELIKRRVGVSRGATVQSFVRLSTALLESREALATNARMLDAAETSFRHGETSVTDLLEMHRSVTEAELARLNLHEAALAAHRELQRLAGGPGPRLSEPESVPNATNNR